MLSFLFPFVTDSYFLINWIDDADPSLYDVVASKAVVPPDNMSIFDVTPGIICRVFFNSQYYRAKIIESGWLLAIAYTIVYSSNIDPYVY